MRHTILLHLCNACRAVMLGKVGIENRMRLLILHAMETSIEYFKRQLTWLAAHYLKFSSFANHAKRCNAM